MKRRKRKKEKRRGDQRRGQDEIALSETHAISKKNNNKEKGKRKYGHEGRIRTSVALIILSPFDLFMSHTFVWQYNGFKKVSCPRGIVG